MNQTLLNIYSKDEQIMLVPHVNNSNNKIRQSKDFNYNFDLPAYSLLYKYSEDVILHSPNTSSLLGLNFDLAC